MNATEQAVDVLIVGAGMAGLVAAGELQRAGRRVRVLDKGRGVGGRMATRRVGGATFDHGAQFLTARDPRFAALLEEARAAGAAGEWCRGFGGEPDGTVRWRGLPAMSAVAKHLATGLDLQLETAVTGLRREGGHWRVETAAGAALRAGAVVLTPPVPQALALLDAGGVALPPECRARLEGLGYERCLAVLALLEGPSRLPAPGGVALAEGPIAWLADNQQKGISAEPAVTLHATPGFSLAHWDRDRGESARFLLEAAAPWLGAGVRSFQVHGWRFSRPLCPDAAPCLPLATGPALVLAGDAWGGSGAEGAAQSGWAAARLILHGEPGPAGRLPG